MLRLALVGLVVTALSLLGYAAGIATPYPGRSFSITGVMIGISLYAIGSARETP